MTGQSEKQARIVPSFQQALELFTQGSFQEAESVCRELLASEPAHSRALHMLARILADEGKITEGLACIERSLQFDPGNLSAQVIYGRLLLYTSRFQDAVTTLERVLRRDPSDVEAHHYLAIALQHTGRLDEAEQATRTALKLQPEIPELLDNLGSILVKRGDFAGARICFEQALALAPDHPGALGNLALWDEQNNRIEEALRLVQQGLAHHPQDSTLRLVLGRCQRRRAEFAAARATLKDLQGTGTPALQKDVEYELALCADGLGEPDTAFEHASRANAVARDLWPRAREEARGFLELVEHLRQRYTAKWLASWSSLPVSQDDMPMFLMGFPRSGTTLLDTMLGAHSAVEVLEERPTLQTMLNTLAMMPGGYPEALSGLTSPRRAALEQSYWRAIPTGVDKNKRILDKSPFSTIHLGAIRRVFAQAPILFMVRHPCDVVLSCFMTNFELNSGTANFLDLGGTVMLYCRVMALWRNYLEVLRPGYKLVRYEDLIAQPEKGMRDLLTYLGLPWTPNVLEHSAHAAVRGRINSASYAQVSRPIYQDAKGRWRRYQKQLEPYLSRLRPYCELFAYDL